MSSVISPRGGFLRTASSKSSTCPRKNSSYTFVTSRAMTAGRLPSISSASSSVSSRRCGASYNASVRGSAAKARNRLRRSVGRDGKKPINGKFVDRHSGRRQRRHKSGCAGHRHHLDSVTQAQAHQPITGIGNRRSAGIGDQGDFRALLQLDDDFRGARDLVVFVITHQALLNVEMREQLHSLAGVFAGDRVGFLQDSQRAQGDVFEVADGRGHDVQASSSGLSGFVLAMRCPRNARTKAV